MMNNLRELNDEGCSLALKEIDGSNPFQHALEYNAPARGVWNIVHIGMLLPESCEVFVCPECCMRGVVLTAAEIHASDRFTCIFITHEDVISGNCEQLVIDGVSEMLEGLTKRPRALSIFTCCLDQFIGTDHEYIYGTLRRRFPDVGFIECYMNPTMRKTMSPDARMRMQLFSLLQPSKNKRKAVNFIGSNAPLLPDNEFVCMLKDSGYETLHIANCRSFEEYERMSESALNILTNPSGEAAVNALEERLGQKALKIPLSYDFAEINEAMKELADALHLAQPDTGAMKAEAVKVLWQVAAELDNMPVAIDDTATSRPFGLAKLLCEYGFRVITIYADTCSPPDLAALEWLKENAGDIEWKFPFHHKMALLPRTASAENGELLAIGQVAAYFTGTKHFVNLVESDGLYGYHGICTLMELIREAAYKEKDTRKLIQVKGLGCCV